MNKKTERKNKTNVNVKWPTTPLFTINDVFDLNNEAKPITLRVRLMKKIEAGDVVEIGCTTGRQGRPRKVFAFTPIHPSTLELAEKSNITMVEENRLKTLSTMPAISTKVVGKSLEEPATV